MAAGSIARRKNCGAVNAATPGSYVEVEIPHKS